jgi:hypothetical protein
VPDRDLLAQDEKHPIAAGLIALVGVGLVVGLLFGVAAMLGARVLGIGGDEAAAQSTAEQSMYLPPFEETTGPSGPLLTLAPGEEVPPSEEQAPTDEQTSKAPKKEISLSASQTQVSPMDQIDLTGIYPGGEGAILQVQRFTSGSWQDFPVTVSVSDQTFSTYVQTSQAGPNRFRVVDTDTGMTSNEVKVMVS